MLFVKISHKLKILWILSINSFTKYLLVLKYDDVREPLIVTRDISL